MWSGWLIGCVSAVLKAVCDEAVDGKSYEVSEHERNTDCPWFCSLENPSHVDEVKV